MSSPINSPNPPVTERASSRSESTKTSLIELIDQVLSEISDYLSRSGGSGGGTKDGPSEGGTKETSKKADEEETSSSSKDSKWQICRKYLSTIVAWAKQKGGSEKSPKKPEDSSRLECFPHKGSEFQPIEKVQNSLVQIKDALKEISSFEEDFRSKIEVHKEQISRLLNQLKPEQSDHDKLQAVKDRLDEINKEMRKLKLQIPSSSSKLSPGGAVGHRDKQKRSEQTGGGESGTKLDKMLSLDESNIFKDSSTHKEIESIYDGLEEEQKKCLLCFSLFAENEELKKRMLTYWWAGEGFLTTDDDDGEKTIEEVADEILNRFVADGLIEPVKKKRQSTTKSYRMRSVVRSAIITFARKGDVFRFNKTESLAAKFIEGNKAPVQKETVSRTPSKGSPTDPKEKEKEKATDQSNQPPSSSSSNNAQAEKTKKDHNSKESSQWLEEEREPEKLETIFNVNEQFPDQRLKLLARAIDKDLNAEEFLLKMKALRVLYLGTWRASAEHHIEVDSTEFLKGLKKMSSLRLLSLQGISRINELTDSIKGLTDLRILDLKACHNLEELPKEISWLQKLTHLDVSDCYLIDHMPKGLSSLVNLQVLKGFIIGDYRTQTAKFCTLENLSGMKKLRKLSVITSKWSFPSDSELKVLENLPELQKLTLSWGADSSQKNNTDSSNQTNETSSEQKKRNDARRAKEKLNKAISRQQNPNEARSSEASTSTWELEKLDLQCYPKPTTPTWLNPEKLNKLKKLYVRGGKLGNENLGLLKEWKSVQTLRLKYLAAVKMDWEEMQRLFPGLIYLEKVDCPLITMCPCDEDGVWVNHAQEQATWE